MEEKYYERVERYTKQVDGQTVQFEDGYSQGHLKRREQTWGQNQIMEMYYENGQLAVQTILKDGKEHCETGPAMVAYFRNGKKGMVFWKINGISHREDGPSYTSYYCSGELRAHNYYRNGVKARSDGPALIAYHKNGTLELEEYTLDALDDGTGVKRVTYHENGTPKEILYFEHGRKARKVCKNQDGVTVDITTYS